MTKESKTDNTSTTENSKPDNKANSNKAVFGPLGKYAVIAVLMVSIIVTTAIMLDKQLGTVDEQLAVIEHEVSEMNKADTESAVTIATESTAAAEAQQTTEVVASETTAINTPSADTLDSIEAAPKETVSDSNQNTEQNSNTAPVAKTNPELTESTKPVRQAQFSAASKDKEWQARIEANKLEQKQHMAEMFTRVKTLEAQQLDRFKISQDEQIKRLRDQIAQQQQLIDAMVLRNKKYYEMREASVQRNQANREQILNRI